MVITDSVPWKEELLKVAVRLEKKKAQQRWTERSGFLVERDIMVSAYAVRKLAEAWKLSDKLTGRSFRVRQHSLIGKAPDVWTRFEYWELYDIESWNDVNLSLRELCNQIIHSWMWSLSATEEPAAFFDGIFVSSDRERRRFLYFIDIDLLITLFRAAGSEDIVHLDMVRKNGEMTFANILAEE